MTPSFSSSMNETFPQRNNISFFICSKDKSTWGREKVVKFSFVAAVAVGFCVACMYENCVRMCESFFVWDFLGEKKNEESNRETSKKNKILEEEAAPLITWKTFWWSDFKKRKKSFPAGCRLTSGQERIFLHLERKSSVEDIQQQSAGNGLKLGLLIVGKCRKNHHHPKSQPPVGIQIRWRFFFVSRKKAGKLEFPQHTPTLAGKTPTCECVESAWNLHK